MMKQEKFECIQEGRMKDALSSTKEISDILTSRGLIISDVSVHPKQKKSLSENNWNRDVLADFKSAKTIERCVFACMQYYRTNQWKQGKFHGSNYQSLLQTEYESRFTAKGIENIWKTLDQWGMNRQGAKLVDLDKFAGILLSNKKELDFLKNYAISDFCDIEKCGKVAKCLSNMFDSLELTSKKPFVTISKTLHFLHPQLMIPMDRKYTLGYFSDFRDSDFPKDVQKQAEWNIGFHRSLSKVYLMHKNLFDNISLDTRYPITKLLDNLLIGFRMYRDKYASQFDISYITKSR